MANRLAGEPSPYLQQHAGNPVDWFPWGEEAFALARERNVPVHLSVGYFACHWCHVMAHESFEDPAIAALLNRNFVNVKVDRQERPDVDDLYQRVVQMMGQSGGWPLTVFLTPQQEPFFAGTYFPPADRYGRPGFPRLLEGIARAWRERQDEVRENCAQFLKGYALHDEQLFAAAGAPPQDLPADAARTLARHADPQHGGVGGAPKFPNVSVLDLMLRVQRRAPDPALAAALRTTLEAMAAGGLRDHLGGGFARYSVDERWEVPHFEKMLYDNGQLVRLYADAARASGEPRWLEVAGDTIAYVLRDLTHPQGGFYASEDADSEGEEGRFYVWTPAQLAEVLGDADAQFAAHAYGVREGGNFEHGRSVLQRRVALSAAEEARLAGIRDRLLAARATRVRPGRDENVLAGWNGLMIQGLCAAYQAGGNTAHLAAAQRAADFVHAHLRTEQGAWWRAWRDGVTRVPGFLDDHAYLANAYFDLYESSFVRANLDAALALVDRMLDVFWDDGLHYTPRDGEALFRRPLAPFDGAWPSGLSQGAFALARAHALTGEAIYGDRARRLWEKFEPAARRNAFGFAHLLAAQEWQRQGPAAVLIAGEGGDAAALMQAVHRSGLPCVLADARHVAPGAALHPVDGRAAAYVCRGQTCQAPVTNADALLELLALR